MPFGICDVRAASTGGVEVRGTWGKFLLCSLLRLGEQELEGLAVQVCLCLAGVFSQGPDAVCLGFSGRKTDMVSSDTAGGASWTQKAKPQHRGFPSGPPPWY